MTVKNPKFYICISFQKALIKSDCKTKDLFLGLAASDQGGLIPKY